MSEDNDDNHEENTGAHEDEQPQQVADVSKETEEPSTQAPPEDQGQEKENAHALPINRSEHLKEEGHIVDPTKVIEAKVEDPEIVAQTELIANSTPSTPLEIALDAALKRKEVHISRLTAEIQKLKAFVSKRKQTYKRKRKDEGAPTRALSAYNIFIQDRFARLAKDNENALRSEDLGAQMKRVPPANLVASTGNEWKELPVSLKAQYEER
jgi:hypothetical protein